jgi:hypothetical protein
MKRVIAVLMCMAMIVTLLAVSVAPVAASTVTKTNLSFSFYGGSVQYTLQAGGSVWGYIYATLKASWWASPKLLIGVGMAYYGCSMSQWWRTSEIDAYGLAAPTVSGNVYNSMGTSGTDGWAVCLRLLGQEVFRWWGVIPIGWSAAARCWQYNGASMTEDTTTEARLVSLAQATVLTELLAHFMGEGLAQY